MPRTTAVRIAARRIDAESPAPARLPDAQPVLDHPELAEREAQEDADRIERDERVRVATERPQDRERDRGQEDDPPRVGEPIATE